MKTRSVNGVSEILAALADIRDRDSDQARSLPAEYYASDAFLELEREEVFRKEWICLGRVEEVPNPGDYFTTELIDEPLIVVRGHDKKVRVLSNVCRHRSSVILEDKGNKKHFVCPYHAWTYANDGQLLRAPYMDQVKGFKVEGCRLPEFKIEVWHGFLYVNLDGKAKPRAPRLKGLEPHIKNYHMGEMTYQFVREEEWSTNWKCRVENGLEGYHLSNLHYDTLGNITPTRLCEKIPGGEGYTAYKSHYPTDFPQRKPYHDDITAEEKRYSMMLCVYPSHVVGLTPNGIVYTCVRPCLVDKVAMRWGVATFGQKPTRKRVKEMVALYNAVIAEDRGQLEQLWRGMNSRYAERSLLGPPDLEGSIWDIYQYMARQLAPKTNRRARLKRAS